MRNADLGSLAAVAALCVVLAGPLVKPAAAQAPPPDKPKAAPAPDKSKASPVPDKSKASPTPDKPKSATPRAERDAARAAQRKQMLEHNALIRKKRAACLQERIDKKIPLFERPSFIRDCMAR